MKSKNHTSYLSILLNIVLLLIIVYCVYSRNDKTTYFDFSKFENSAPKQEYNNTVICFVGNSITANWINLDYDFFKSNSFVNRGVGGQSSSQILLRFQQDVIFLNPNKVVLNTGINDIGEADGFYKKEFTVQNIQSIVDICKANDIEIILTAVLPATDIRINRFSSISDVQSKIIGLNKEIRKLAAANELIYIDYYSKLANEDGTFNELYTFDGVHPNEKGYDIMKELVLSVLNK